MQLRQAGSDILATVACKSGRRASAGLGSEDEVRPRGMKAQKSARYLGLRKQENRKAKARGQMVGERASRRDGVEQQPWQDDETEKE